MGQRSTIIALLLALFAGSLANAQGEQDRVCTLSDIDAALSGSYSGPGCHFTIDASPEAGVEMGARPVVLPDSFFYGPSTGGVGGAPGPYFLYRGIILVSAHGEVRHATEPQPGPVLLVRYPDGVRTYLPVATPVIAPRRAYPGH